MSQRGTFGIFPIIWSFSNIVLFKGLISPNIHIRKVKMNCPPPSQSNNKIATCFAFALASCASPSQYMGISLHLEDATFEVQRLAYRARAGDKHAQLELGIAFEEGNGVHADREKARALYQLAATDSRSRWTYVPSPGNGAPPRVENIEIDPTQAGLPEAKVRLAKLTGQQDLN